MTFAEYLFCFIFYQIPKIHWDLSTKRILIMDFAEGGQVNDCEYMRKHGINVNEVRYTSLSLHNCKTQPRFLQQTTRVTTPQLKIA